MDSDDYSSSEEQLSSTSSACLSLSKLLTIPLRRQIIDLLTPLEFRARCAAPGEDKPTRVNAMSWIYLVLAGILEAVWAVGLKYTEGFSRPGPSVVVSVAIMGSMLLLSLALRTIPIGTGYAIWVSIGAMGTFLAGPLLFNQPLRPIQILFVVLLVVSKVGLKITSSVH